MCPSPYTILGPIRVDHYRAVLIQQPDACGKAAYRHGISRGGLYGCFFFSGARFELLELQL